MILGVGNICILLCSTTNTISIIFYSGSRYPLNRLVGIPGIYVGVEVGVLVGVYVGVGVLVRVGKVVPVNTCVGVSISVGVAICVGEFTGVG